MAAERSSREASEVAPPAKSLSVSTLVRRGARSKAGDRRCFISATATGQALAYAYFEEEPGRRAAAKLLTRDEARRIATNIAKLPELLTKPSR
jgi:hypothetical protein